MGLFGLPRSPRGSNATLDVSPATLPGDPSIAASLPTPRLDLDPALAVARYEELAQALPGTGIRYAVKANPHPLLLALLAAAGCGFDAASPAEVQLALNAGAAADTLIHSNPIARRADLAEVYRMGVRLFVVDAHSELDKLADVAPEAAVLIRLATTGEGSDWPLSRKYGCSADHAVDLLVRAAELGLDPAGVAFHVGSQQRQPRAWDAPLKTAADVFARARAAGLTPRIIDLGGGFPAGHEGDHPDLTAYGTAIREALVRSFPDPDHRPQTLAEPGRGIVGDAGVVVTSVVSVIDRGGVRWVYLDAGVFTGLVETLDEAIRYRLSTSADGGPTGPVVLAGPTCDSADVLYEKQPVHLPLALAEGDEVRFHSAGAYTTCYSTVGFNGFDPMPTVVVTGDQT